MYFLDIKKIFETYGQNSNSRLESIINTLGSEHKQILISEEMLSKDFVLSVSKLKKNTIFYDTKGNQVNVIYLHNLIDFRAEKILNTGIIFKNQYKKLSTQENIYMDIIRNKSYFEVPFYIGNIRVSYIKTVIFSLFSINTALLIMLQKLRRKDYRLYLCKKILKIQ